MNQSEESEDKISVFPFLTNLLTKNRGQKQFCLYNKYFDKLSITI